MDSSKITRFLISHLIHPRLFKSPKFLAFFAAAMVTFPFFMHFAPEGGRITALALALELVLIILVILWDRIVTISDSHCVRIFSDATKAQKEFLDGLENSCTPKEVLIIHHSGNNLNHALLFLVERSDFTNIKICLKDHETTISPHQREVICSFKRSIPYYFRDDPRFKWHYYAAPASVRGILVKDEAICIGWYTYEGFSRATARIETDNNKVWGHNTGAIVVRKESPEFEEIQSFFISTFEMLTNGATWLDAQSIAAGEPADTCAATSPPAA